MRTQYDSLLQSDDTKLQKSPSQSWCVPLSGAAAFALFIIVCLMTERPAHTGPISLAKTAETVDEPSARVVMYFKANDVLDQTLSLSGPSMTHLILSDLESVEEDRVEAVKERLAELQADGVAVMLSVNEEKQEQLRSDFPTNHASLNAAIENWNADGLEVSGAKCLGEGRKVDEHEGTIACNTADLMRLVAAIRADCDKPPPGGNDFIVTVRAGAHQVFGSDHTSRQVLRNLVYKQELNDDIDFLTVHFDAAWTEDLAQKILVSMEENEYEADTIVPIMQYGEQKKEYLSLDELFEKFGVNFGGFGADFSE